MSCADYKLYLVFVCKIWWHFTHWQVDKLWYFGNCNPWKECSVRIVVSNKYQDIWKTFSLMVLDLFPILAAQHLIFSWECCLLLVNCWGSLFLRNILDRTQKYISESLSALKEHKVTRVFLAVQKKWKMLSFVQEQCCYIWMSVLCWICVLLTSCTTKLCWASVVHSCCWDVSVLSWTRVFENRYLFCQAHQVWMTLHLQSVILIFLESCILCFL